MRRSSLLVAALGCLLGLCRPAAAQDGQSAGDLGPTGVLSVGKTYSFGGGADLQHGFGMDLRYAVYPEAGMDGYFGLFGHGEYETGEAWRVVGGVQGGWGLFGLELGVSHRTETSGFLGSTGLHVGQSFSLGPLSIGGRLTIPLVDYRSENMPDPRAVQGFEAAVVLRLSYGFRVHGRPRPNSSHGCHGQTGGLRNPHASHGHHGAH